MTAEAPERDILAYTSGKLRAAGRDAEPLERAAAACFRGAKDAPTATVQAFWDTFAAARKALGMTGGGMHRSSHV